MTLLAGLLMVLALPPAPSPVAPAESPLRAIDCVRVKARPLAATARTEAGIAYESVRACESMLDGLFARAKAASGRERDTLTLLRLSLLDRMLTVAAETVRQQRGR